jgi:hypothetical protein
MNITRQALVEMLRRAGLPELAKEAQEALPDPVECTRVENFLARFGITKDELISRVGGSP